MEIWRILGIDPTGEQRAIKRAYAIKLKQIDIEQQPEEFQQLHQAYKEALSFCDIGGEFSSQESTEFDPHAIETEKELKARDGYLQHQVEFEQAQLLSHQEDAELKPLLGKIRNLLASSTPPNQVESWIFLQRACLNLAIDQQRSLSFITLELVLKYNSRVVLPSGKLDEEVLHFLDKNLHWLENLEFWQQFFNPDHVEALKFKLKKFRYIPNSRDTRLGLKGGAKLIEMKFSEKDIFLLPQASLGMRSISTLIDIGIIFVVFNLLQVSSFSMEPLVHLNRLELVAQILQYSAALFLYACACELSPWRRTIGKAICGIRLAIDINNSWCIPCQIFMRQTLAFLPLLLALVYSFNFHLGWMLSFVWVVRIAFEASSTDKAIRDELTHTRVVNIQSEPISEHF